MVYKGKNTGKYYIGDLVIITNSGLPGRAQLVVHRKDGNKHHFCERVPISLSSTAKDVYYLFTQTVDCWELGRYRVIG